MLLMINAMITSPWCMYGGGNFIYDSFVMMMIPGLVWYTSVCVCLYPQPLNHIIIQQKSMVDFFLLVIFFYDDDDDNLYLHTHVIKIKSFYLHFKDRYFFSIFDVKIAISFFYVLSIRTNQQQQHPIIHMKYLTRKVFFHRITLSSSYIDCCCFCNFFLLLSLHSLHPFRAKKKNDYQRKYTEKKKQ